MSAPSVEEFEKLIGHLLNQQNLFVAANVYKHELIASATKDKEDAKSAVISAYRAALGDGWHERINGKLEPPKFGVMTIVEFYSFTGFTVTEFEDSNYFYDIKRWRYLDGEG